MFNVMWENVIKIRIANNLSFHVKYGWNGDLSLLGFNLIGFEDPLMCRVIRCRITMEIKMNGNVKCIIKNRDSVA